MKLLIVAVGQRVPDWAQTAYDDYAKRFPPELKVELKAVKTEPRGSKTLETLYAAERERIEAAIRERDLNDLSPLVLTVPAETHALVSAINAFMQRLAVHRSMVFPLRSTNPPESSFITVACKR